jgi:hypothetical protein
MAMFEQLICGMRPESPDSGFSVLSHSPGVGLAVQEEILRHCLGWGDAPAGGLSRPAVLSFPLNSTMPSIRGALFAVIRVSTGVVPFFHAVIMSRLEFRNFDSNPFAVVCAGSFLDSWSGGGRLARGIIEPPAGDTVFSPPPNPGDVGLVDEALQLFLAKGKLLLNLEAPTAESDRALGLVIQSMPQAKREKLRFASFAPHGENISDLAASQAKDTPFSSWQRLFMTMIEQGAPESVRRYVAQVRNGLAAGCLDPAIKEDLPEPRNPAPQAREPRPLLSDTIQTAGSPQSRENRTVSRPKPPARTTAIKPTTAAILPAMNPGTRDTGLNRASWQPAPEPTQAGGRSRLVRQAMPMNRRGRRGQPHALAIFLVIMILLGGSWVYLDRSGKGREWGIFDLANLNSDPTEVTRSASLLAVIDVGQEYDRQLASLNRTKIMPGVDRDQALRRAQAALLAEAAGPLIVQVDLFLDLAGQGIQQGRWPDREKDRLNSIDIQGQVLAEELGRLELAYYSLQSGSLWQDLDALGSQEIMARRDSLLRVDKGKYSVACQDAGTPQPLRSLALARSNVRGMVGLLTLFAEEAWSEDWEREMKLAAELVSPSASPITRAYRNNAFTLVRLKHAEHHEAGRAAAFGREFSKQGCVSPAVLDILPELRRRAALFSGGELPDLLTGVLTLYRQLEDPATLAGKMADSAEVLASLKNNPAVRFDSLAYGDLLNRIQFEALAGLLDKGLAPEELPEHLTQGFDLTTAVLFHKARGLGASAADWRGLASMTEGTFLGQWAGIQENRAWTRREELLESMDQHWAQGQELARELDQRSARAEDWTSVWVDLQAELEAILTVDQPSPLEDPARWTLWNQAAALKAELDRSRSLELERVVVRLDQDSFQAPGTVQVELLVAGEARVAEVAEVLLGPSAPEGTGWVGTVNLNWMTPILPSDPITVRVLDSEGRNLLLEVSYASLRDREGPGALARTRQGEGGSLVFEVGEGWWRQMRILEIP